MTDRPGSPFPGNAHAIDGEVRRLRALRDHLESTGDQVRRLSVAGWDGAAHEAFESFRQAFHNRWYAVADLHGDAAWHLDRYHQTLLELRRKAATAGPVLGGVAPAADDLARWRDQLDSAARDAARAMRVAARALDSLPTLLPEEPAPPPASAAPPARPPRPAPAPDHDRNLDPRTAHADPSRFRDQVSALWAEIATATLITVG